MSEHLAWFAMLMVLVSVLVTAVSAREARRHRLGPESIKRRYSLQHLQLQCSAITAGAYYVSATLRANLLLMAVALVWCLGAANDSRHLTWLGRLWVDYGK